MQLRQRKRENLLTYKRKLTGPHSAPILVTIIPLQEDLDTHSIVSIIKHVDDTAEAAVSPCGITHMCVPKLKKRFSLMVPAPGNIMAMLDAIRVSTTVLFVISATGRSKSSLQSCIIDHQGEEILRQCLAQGLTNYIVALVNLDDVPIKNRHETNLRAQESISSWLPKEKIMLLDDSADSALNLLRRVAFQKQKIVDYKKNRPHLLANSIKYNSSEHNAGILEVTGYLRGRPLSVNSLIYIPGFGEYQMSRIDEITDPYPLHQGCTRNSTEDMTMNEDVRIIGIADPSKQESLQNQNIPDPMDAEQTWPTGEDIAEAESERKASKIVKLVPKGTSEYQAAWIPDEDAIPNDNYPLEEHEDCDMLGIEDIESGVDSTESNAGSNDDEEFQSVTVSEATQNMQSYDEQIDLHEESRAMENIKKAKLDAKFPDEVDTPHDMSAKIRFQKYRGLESFRTSPWDPKENLPFDYAKIYQFENFDCTRRRIYREIELQEELNVTAPPGCYVTIHVKGVNQELFDAYQKTENFPLTIFGLLPNEQKMSLVNITLTRIGNVSKPIKSKERLVFQCGFRRFTACPIFSQHTNGSKHKYERYFQPNSTVVASLYAPITFPPCPVICYIENTNGLLELIATGNLLSVNPDRIIVKRAVLSGHPFKVHKRSAVVRFMFYNREDVMWFKPVQLRTKYGRRGHIKEPLGTHGYMKCVFDGQLKSQDTILLNLFKRVFPKWTYEPLLFTKMATDGNKFNIE
ncbi:pre-rRNA-processing protein TSR1 homolog isoform X2 [Venturia canescens]|nr:pre-rRNA-processing protein TSR1 homolog isoform X2 [Venturia canescens]